MSDRILRKLFSWQEAWISCRELFLARIVHDDDDDRRRGGGRSSSNRRNTESSQRRFGYSVIRFAKEDESEGSSRRDRSNGDNYLDLKERRSPFVDFELSGESISFGEKMVRFNVRRTLEDPSPPEIERAKKQCLLI
uniref:uncharacterized protein LOC117611814 isoform X7 n=1 Tax=Osmia lignaria TaxID=473952 RepID=UPI0014790B8D|nr:uncharacterized protein LOC117611814 isoform X7 [Osmia lignaria]